MHSGLSSGAVSQIRFRAIDVSSPISLLLRCAGLAAERTDPAGLDADSVQSRCFADRVLPSHPGPERGISIGKEQA